MKESIDKLNMSQNKLIGILSEASTAFLDNYFVGSMNYKFLNMNKNANMFTINRLCGKNVSVPITDEPIQPVEFNYLNLWGWVHADINDSK